MATLPLGLGLFPIPRIINSPYLDFRLAINSPDSPVIVILHIRTYFFGGPLPRLLGLEGFDWHDFRSELLVLFPKSFP